MTDPSAAAATGLRRHWALDPALTFLNHGSYGACPRMVMASQSALREELERDPVHFFSRAIQPKLARAKQRVAEFVGARVQDVALVRNATAGVNAVLRSLVLQPGDELLITDHAYHACRNALDFVTQRSGARAVVVALPFAVQDSEALVQPILDAVTKRTRLALLDHITSPTGLVMPVERIVPALRARGVESLVDGAHAPGQIPLDLERLGAGYYTGNFHKWVCAPKGAAMLHVRADLQPGLHPPVISHGWSVPDPDSRFQLEFDWTGTDDPTPWLVLPEAIDFLGGLFPGGWPQLRARNRAMLLRARDMLAGTLGEYMEGTPPLPASALLSHLAAIPVPPEHDPEGAAYPFVDPLHRALHDRHRIQVPVFPWPARPTRMLRISCHAHNEDRDYERLAEALRAELGGGHPAKAAPRRDN